jgi:peptidoglycan hydrolase CwlO-like protein
MKIMIFLAALTIPLMAGIMFTGYQSSTQKKEAAQAKVQDVNQDLNAAQKDTDAIVQKVTTAKEWKTFNKSEVEQKIKANEMRITELNIKVRKNTELFDAFYVKKIANLEKENRFSKARLEAYEKSQRDMGSN